MSCLYKIDCGLYRFDSVRGTKIAGFISFSSSRANTNSFYRESRKMDTMYVCSYTEFENLAHTPNGKKSEAGISIFEKVDGKYQLKKTIKGCPNASFGVIHNDFLYVAEESILEMNWIYCYKILPDGDLEFEAKFSAQGLSCCYFEIVGDKFLVNNYWDSALAMYKILPNGHLELISVRRIRDAIKKVSRKEHLENRHSEEHYHCICSDKNNTNVVFVPDLGLDKIHQFRIGSGEFVLEKGVSLISEVFLRIFLEFKQSIKQETFDY